jgi:hypothetical protein
MRQQTIPLNQSPDRVRPYLLGGSVATGTVADPPGGVPEVHAMTTHTKDFAELTADLGEPARDNGPLNKHFWCPACGSTDNLHVWIDQIGLGVHCFGCEAGAPEVREAIGAGATPPMKVKRSRRKSVDVVGRQRFEVRDRDGALVAVHVRLDLSDGSKMLPWERPDGRRGAPRPLENMPLYGSEDVAGFDRAQPVIVTEGERKGDRLKAARYQTLALTGGASVTPTAEVLSVLDGLDVILWPDNDADGRAVMDRVARAIRGRASAVSVVTWTDAPPKGDAADFLESHSVEECDALLKAAAPVSARRFEIISARDLLVTTFAPLEFVVPDVLPEGTALLISPPKIGKSSLVVQIVVALRMGGEVLGRQVEVRDALYLALEDGKLRMQERLLTHLAPYRGIYKPMRDLGIVLDAPRIGDGLEEMLAGWYDEHPRGAVFVDTLQHVRPLSTGRRNAYEVDVEDFRRLRSVIVDRPGASLTMVHHTNKPNSADDFLAAVSGTHGLAGTADTTIRVKRNRHSPEGVLEVTGRDVEELELPVRYEGMIWRADADRPLIDASDLRNDIYAWLSANGPASPIVIARGIGEERSNVAHRLAAMLGTSDVVRIRDGVYDVPRFRVHVGKPITTVTPHTVITPVTAVTPDTPESDRTPDQSDRGDGLTTDGLGMRIHRVKVLDTDENRGGPPDLRVKP